MFFLFIFGLIGFIIGRTISIVVSMFFTRKSYLNVKSVKVCIVLGSGGHTTEMLEIVKNLNFDKYSPRYYVVAENDQHSIDKLLNIEKDKTQYKIYLIPRSRKVHQSYLSSITTTLQSTLTCIPLILHSRPDLILCNGPGTCVPVCFVAFFLKVLYIHSSCKIAFIESYCRVKTLSLTGWILLYFSDLFVVQWPKLCDKSRKILYFGRLA